MLRGTSKIDSVTVGEFTAVFLGPEKKVVAKGAFLNSRTGETHGWTQHAQWGEATLKKLQELKLLMEVDLAKAHLEGVESTTPGAGPSPEEGLRFRDEERRGGLGEFLEEVESV